MVLIIPCIRSTEKCDSAGTENMITSIRKPNKNVLPHYSLAYRFQKTPTRSATKSLDTKRRCFHDRKSIAVDANTILSSASASFGTASVSLRRRYLRRKKKRHSRISRLCRFFQDYEIPKLHPPGSVVFLFNSSKL